MGDRPAEAFGRVPRVTIGIPVYNAVRTLPMTLRSVFCQTFTDWELVLVDDGSTDGSVEMMRSIKDQRVRVFVDGLNKTQGPRHNEITRHARAPLIALMDADDVMHPDRLRIQLEFMETHPDVDLVGTGVYSIDSTYRLQGKRWRSRLPSTEYEVGSGGLFVQPTILGKRSWFRDNPYNDSEHARRCEDAELWLRTFARTTPAVIIQPLLFYMEDVDAVITKLRSSSIGRVRVMFRGNSEIRNRKLSMRLALAVIISMKMLVNEVCWAVGARRYLVTRRNLPVEPYEAAEAKQVLERIRRTLVPGMEETESSSVPPTDIEGGERSAASGEHPTARTAGHHVVDIRLDPTRGHTCCDQYRRRSRGLPGGGTTPRETACG